MFSERNEEEKKALKRLGANDVSKYDAGKKIEKIRQKYALLEQSALDEKAKMLEILKEQHLGNIDDFVQNFQHDNDVSLVWDSDLEMYKAVKLQPD